MLGGVIDLAQNRLQYCIGGHLPLPVLYGSGKAQYLEGKGLPIGLFAEASYEDHLLDLPADFSLTLMSDGILELLSDSTLEQKEQALLSLVAQSSGTLEGLVTHLGLSDVRDMPDDIALLVLSRNLA